MYTLVFQLILLNDKHKLRLHLRDKKEDVNLQYGGLSTLCFAIKFQSNDCFDILLDYGADPKQQDSEFQFPPGNNALIHAMLIGNVHCVSELLGRGIRFADDSRLMLDIVFQEDNYDMLVALTYFYREILSNCNFYGFYNDRPIQLAIRVKASRCLRYLLTANLSANVLIYSADSAILSSIDELNYDAYKFITSLPCCMQLDFSRGLHFLLHRAVMVTADTTAKIGAKCNIVDHLLKYISPNQRDGNNNTPLHFVDDMKTARQLIAAGAFGNVFNDFSQLPHETVDSSQEDSPLVEFLKVFERSERERVDLTE